jgi:hypothetical protein
MENKKELMELKEFVLTRANKTPIFREKDVIVKQVAIGKKGPEYEVLDEEGKKIGIVKEDKTFVFDKKYKEELKNKMGPMYNLIGFDKDKLEFDVQKKVKEQEEKNNNSKTDKIEEKKEIKKEVNQEAEKETNKDNKKEDNSLTEKELKSYNNVKIKDFEFVADMVSPNKYNIYDSYFINKDGKFHMMALNLYTGKYEEVEEYLRKDLNAGKQDTLEKNREETEIGIAQKITYRDRYGDRVELNFNQLDSGEIEARVSYRHREGSKTGDIDKDGDDEGIKISTDRDRANQKIKKYDHIKDDVNEIKERNFVESSEVNQGELKPEQIRQIISEKIEEAVIEERDEMSVIQLISSKYPTKNPTKDELEELIDNYALNKEEKQIDEQDEDREELEPGYKRGPDGILRFRGMPVE